MIHPPFQGLDTFSGIGGFSKGLEGAGMKTVAFCESDKKCRMVLDKWWPDVKKYDDIRTLTAEKLRKDGIGPIDLICGGFPCQPFSVAGKRGGQEDDRHLWPEMLRVIKEVQPNWIICENVTGILSISKPIGDPELESRQSRRFKDSDEYHSIFTRQEKLFLGEFIQDINEAGYKLPELVDGTPVILCIPACGVGAPHRRDRIWVVAHSIGQGTGNKSRTVNLQRPDAPKGWGKTIRHGYWTFGSNRTFSTGPFVADTKRRTKRPGFCPSEPKRKRWRRSGDDGLSIDVTHPETLFREKEFGIEPDRDIQSIKILANAAGSRREQCRKRETKSDYASPGSENGSNPSDPRLQKRKGFQPGEPGAQPATQAFSQWDIEPDVGRVANGVPGRVDRLKQLGNAVVPQIPEIIGRAIMRIEYGND